MKTKLAALLLAVRLHRHERPAPRRQHQTVWAMQRFLQDRWWDLVTPVRPQPLLVVMSPQQLEQLEQMPDWIPIRDAPTLRTLLFNSPHRSR